MALSDRPTILSQLTQVVAGAWSSFDRPRPSEPTVAPELAERLSAPLPEEGDSSDAALADAARVLDASRSPSRPLYLAYIGSTGLEIGMVGDAMAAAYDVNLAVSAGGADLVERQALEWVSAFVGFPAVDGVFTSGGMTSNLTALVAAREAALPGSRDDGLTDVRPAIYCSREAHHSVVRAVEVLGLGRRAVRLLALDDQRRMVPSELDAAIAADREAGVTPVAVVANAGTTLTGAVDPIDAIADVCAKHGVWLHVDGAYGLPAAASETAGHLFAGLDRADSCTIDAHKWLGVPKACSVVLLRREGALHAAFGHEESYMLHHGNVLNAVDRTLEYSRPFRSLKLWLAFRVHGAAQMRRWIDGTLGHARRFAELVDEDPEFELICAPSLSTVCFRHAGGGDEHNVALAHAVQEDGRVFLAPAVVDGRACQRACFVNFRTTDDQIPYILDVLRELAQEV